MDDRRRIVAMGGGGFSMEPDNRSSMTSCCRSRAATRRGSPSSRPPAGTRRPTSPTSTARSAHAAAASPTSACSTAGSPTCAPTCSRRTSSTSAAATPRACSRSGAHRLERALVDAWHAGVVLAGISAGMNCWFQQSVTDSFAPEELAALDGGLGLLAGSACPHFDGEDQRRPTYRRLVSESVLRDGWAADDGAALVFAGEDLHEVVASRPDAAAYRVERTADGVAERRVPARFLG